MIPRFPNFKGLELSDRDDVENFTKKFPPYSDFNFVSMWSWDTEGKMCISQLNDNLVVRFTDYLTGELFYSFLGGTKVNETAEKLLDFSVEDGLVEKLGLIPEVTAEKLSEKKFSIIEERDHFDYILDVGNIKDFSGNSYKGKRNLVNNLLKNKDVRITSPIGLGEVINFFEKSNGPNEIYKIKKEQDAIVRIFNIKDSKNIISLGLYNTNDDLVGFVINEVIPHNQYSIGHFLKMDSRYHGGVGTYLLKSICQVLHQNKCNFLNIEQDLGLAGLRTWKENHKPICYLKKYKVTKL